MCIDLFFFPLRFLFIYLFERPLSFHDSNDIVIVIFCSFEIEGVAVDAAKFFFVHNVLRLLFGWTNDTSVLICNTWHLFRLIYVPNGDLLAC